MYARINLGDLKPEIKPSSTYTISPGVPFSDAASMYGDSAPTGISYVTWEKDGGFPLSRRADNPAIVAIMNPPVESTWKYGQKYVSKQVADATGASDVILDITLAIPTDIPGVTMTFDSAVGYAPKTIIITTYNAAGTVIDTQSITENVKFSVMFLHAFSEFKRIRLSFVGLEPYQRVRLLSIQLGVGFVFSGDAIMDLTHRRLNHPLSATLPVNDLKFTLFNENGIFDLGTDNSLVQFLSTEWEIKLEYGYDITGAGDVEWFNGGIFYLDSWDTNGIRASFSGVDIFYRLTQSIYYKGVFRKAVWGYWGLAQEVLEDAGVEKYNVYSTNMVYSNSHAPLVYASHAENLQLLASGSSSTLMQREDGTVDFLDASMSDKSTWVLSFTTQPDGTPIPEPPFSDINSVWQQGNVEYALWEENYFRLDGSVLLLPESEDYLSAGFAPNLFPDDNGLYSIIYPGGVIGLADIRATFGYTETYNSIEVAFSESSRVGPIRTSAQPSVAVPVDGTSVVVTGPVYNSTFVSVTPYSSAVYQRLRIQYLNVSRFTDLSLIDRDVIGYPHGELRPECKMLSVSYDSIWYWSVADPVVIANATVFPGVITEIRHGEPSYDLYAVSDDPNVVFDVEEHYAYTSFVRISGVADSASVQIMGLRYAKTSRAYETRNLGTKGEDIVFENPIATNQSVASRFADTAAAYYTERRQYDIETLGYPECDPIDEIEFDGLRAVVLENNITFNGGAMRGKMKMRVK